jgi:serine/threonine protein kinase
LTSAHDLEKPRTQALDDFVVKHLLGKGAFGEVYLAYHKRTERYMAMKQMDKSLIRMQGKVSHLELFSLNDSPSQIQHIMNEKEILCNTKSPYLVRMHYSFQTKECLYLTMEYCSGIYAQLLFTLTCLGGDLRHFLDAVGSLEEEECALFFAEMIMAVHDLHKMGYLHRDIKPENFLIDPKYVFHGKLNIDTYLNRGHLKLADFGLSKQMIGVEDDSPVNNLLSQSEISLEELQSRRHRLSLLPGMIHYNRLCCDEK